MQKNVADFLKDKNVIVELKGYKEMPTGDGHHMRGSLYINGKNKRPTQRRVIETIGFRIMWKKENECIKGNVLYRKRSDRN